MNANSRLEHRVEILEENMEQLRDVPARLLAVESQIVQLRAEMQTGFSSLRELNDETKAQPRFRKGARRRRA
jgi:hypothetical protein